MGDWSVELISIVFVRYLVRFVSRRLPEAPSNGDPRGQPSGEVYSYRHEASISASHLGADEGSKIP